jgi:hypothetical protein
LFQCLMACYLRHQELHRRYQAQFTEERLRHHVQVHKLTMELQTVQQEVVSHLHTQTTHHHCFPLLLCVYRKLLSLLQPRKCILRNHFKECVMHVCSVCMVVCNLYSWLVPFLQAKKSEGHSLQEPGEGKNLYYYVPEFTDKTYS